MVIPRKTAFPAPLPSILGQLTDGSAEAQNSFGLTKSIRDATAYLQVCLTRR